MNAQSLSKKDLLRHVLDLQQQLKQQESVGNPPQEGSEQAFYTILNRSSQVGFYIVQKGRLRFLNSHFQSYTGYPAEELLGMDPTSLILQEDRAETFHNAVSMLKERRFSPYEFRIVAKNGNIKWIVETVMPINFKGKRAVLGSSMDVTELKEASRRLEELEALESSILDAIPQAVVGLQERRINFANQAVKTVFGWDQEDLIGKSIRVIYRSDEDAEAIGAIFYSRLEHQRTFEKEFPCRRQDGREIICRMRASRIGDRLSEKRIVITFDDITEQKKAQEELERSRQELRNLSAHLQSIREEESSRIARKIHDELGQSMTALQMDLSWLAGRLATENNDVRTKVHSMSELTHATLASVHKITTELRPSLLDDLGLPAAIEWQADDFQQRSGIQCHVRINCTDSVVDRERATTIFRIFQEILTNMARHSEATRCRISLTERERELHLDVRDNGVGITRQQIDDLRSFGMIGMRERAHLWGGAVRIRNARPSGTIVSVMIPKDQGDTHD